MSENSIRSRPTSRLQRETRQRRPFRSPAQEAAVALLRTADTVRRHFSELLESHGITLPQYNVLRVLRGAGPDGLPTLEVADRLIERTPGITRMMDRLEAKGWVWRERSPEDRRVVICHLAPAGGKLLARLDAPMDEADERALKPLTVTELKRLIDMLDRVRDYHA